MSAAVKKVTSFLIADIISDVSDVGVEVEQVVPNGDVAHSNNENGEQISDISNISIFCLYYYIYILSQIRFTQPFFQKQYQNYQYYQLS